MNQLQIFNNPAFGNVRAVMVDDDPWFVAKDVCICLGIENVSQALSYLDEDEKCIITNDTLNDTTGLRKDSRIVSEPGLYSLILRSRKPEAKAFKRWITHEVLPSIRKHGAYITGPTLEELLADPDLIMELGAQLKAERARNKLLVTENIAISRDNTRLRNANIELEVENKSLTEDNEVLSSQRNAAQNQFWKNQADVAYGKSFRVSSKAIEVGEMARRITQNTKLKIGRKKLFAKMRNLSWVLKSKNEPTQLAVEAGYLVLFEKKYRNRQLPSYKQILVTPKGQNWLIDYFLDGWRLC